MPGNDRLTETIVSLAESLSQAARESAVNLSAPLEKPLDGGKINQGRRDVNGKSGQCAVGSEQKEESGCH